MTTELTGSGPVGADVQGVPDILGQVGRIQGCPVGAGGQDNGEAELGLGEPAASDPSTIEDACPHGLASQDCQPCEEAAIIAGDIPPLTCGRCSRSVPGEPVQRVVFGDELGEGTTVLEPCRGPRVCSVTASQHCPTAAGFTSEPDFHQLTLQRLRRSHSGWITAVITDQNSIEQPWQSGPDTPVRVVATTVPAAAGATAAVAVPDPATEWAGIPADPRWDPYRLRMAGPRWWRPWWTAHVDYLGAWTTHGDQTIIRVRSWRRTRAQVEAADALVDHCCWLTEYPHPDVDVDLVPVVWLGAHLVPVAQLTGPDPAQEDQGAAEVHGEVGR